MKGNLAVRDRQFLPDTRIMTLLTKLVGMIFFFLSEMEVAVPLIEDDF